MQYLLLPFLRYCCLKVGQYYHSPSGVQGVKGLKKHFLSPSAISCTKVWYIRFASLFFKIHWFLREFLVFFRRFRILLRCKCTKASKTSSSSIIIKLSYKIPAKLFTLFHQLEQLVSFLASFLDSQTKLRTAHACFFAAALASQL